MNRDIIKSIVSFSIVIALCLAWVNASADASCPHSIKDDALARLDAIIVKTATVPAALRTELDRAKKRQANDALPEETISALIQNTFKAIGSSLSPQDRKTLDFAQDALEDCLSQYRVTGYAFTVDPNGAFFSDEQNPSFEVYFQAPGSNAFKKRRYNASINSFGLKIQFAIKLNLVFFTDTAFDFYSSDNEIELGTGIDLGLSSYLVLGSMFNLDWLKRSVTPQLNFTYAPFKNAQGGIVIVGLTLGFDFDFGSGLGCSNLSVVTGGKLTPAT